MTAGKPDFDLDLRWGLYGEDTVAAMLKARGELVEVKSPRNKRLSFYIETHCDRGRRGRYSESGILTSRAEVWIYNFMDPDPTVPASLDATPACFFVMRRLDLLAHIRSGQPRRAAFNDGNCPTKGYEVHIPSYVAWLRDGKPTRKP